MSFGSYLRRLRKARGLTLGKAASELGMPIQRLCDIESGRRNVKKPPSMEVLKLIASVYNCSLSEIIENTSFYQREASVVDHLVSEVEPLVDDIVARSLEMLVEAKQYTPEMERSATLNYRAAQDVQLAIQLVKRRARGMVPDARKSTMRRFGG